MAICINTNLLSFICVFLEEVCEKFAMIEESSRGIVCIFGSKLSVVQSSALEDIIDEGFDHSVLLINFIETNGCNCPKLSLT